MQTDCSCEACENALGETLSRLINSFGRQQAANKLAASYGIEISESDISDHIDTFDLIPALEYVGSNHKESELQHTPIILEDVTPERWGLSLERGEEAVGFIQEQLLTMCLLQLEVCKSQQIEFLTGRSSLLPSKSQFSIMSQLFRDLDRYSGISLNAVQQKALAIAARIQKEIEIEMKQLPTKNPEEE